MASSLAKLVTSKIPIIFNSPFSGNEIELIDVPLSIPQGLNQRVREEWYNELERKSKIIQGKIEIKPFQTALGESKALYLNGNPILYPGPILSLSDIEVLDKARFYVSNINYSYLKASQNPDISALYKYNGKNIITPFWAATLPLTLDCKIALTLRGENAGAYPNALWAIGGQLESAEHSLEDFLAEEISDELLVSPSDYDSKSFQFGGVIENPESIGVVSWIPIDLTSQEIKTKVNARSLQNRPVDAVDVVFAPANPSGLFDYMTRRTPYSFFCNSGFEGLYLFGMHNFGQDWANGLLTKLN